ncbi:MAG: NAD-dependent epimerase/dehydratase family protein [Nitrosopumilales archaeon]|nr:MAG: NAD-dependent epimerase/dehydratase family protein [Nitrosopumilales archaeon]
MKKLTSRIVITGANGFIARNLRRFLNEKKIATICIARRNFRNYKSETKIISTEFSHIPISKLKNSNSLIHLIGIGKETPENSYQSTNIELTKKIIRLCKKAKIKKIIYNSGLGVSKETASSYFSSKLKAEQLIINSGLDYTIFRPSYILGKDDLLSQNLKKQIKKGSIIIPGSGNYKLQPISVNDVAEIILQATTSKKFSKKIIDLVGPETVSFENFVKRFSNLNKIKIKKINLDDAYFDALYNPRSIYSVDDLNIMLGSYTGNFRTLEKASGLKLKSYKEILKSSSLS